jgi:hypothetical protein
VAVLNGVALVRVCDAVALEADHVWVRDTHVGGLKDLAGLFALADPPD